MPEQKQKTKKGISLSAVLARLRRQTGLLFWAVLVLLILMEASVLKGSIALVLSAKESEKPLEVSQTVRVNFANYDAIAKRMDGAASYAPATEVRQNPFGTIILPPAAP